ncbi:MAG: LicD family protein [Clostridium sp.]|nr:LicD family protein [Clostridium sp.]
MVELNDSELLKKAQERMLDILKEVHRVCEENNIKYFLIDGTLLGAIRHKGFIPWDDDVDIGMLRDDYNKFIKIAKEKLGKDYFLQNMETDPNYNRFHIPLKVRDNRSKLVEVDEKDNENFNQGIYIDIFAFDTLPKNTFLRKIQKLISRFIVLCDVRTRRVEDNLSIQNKIAFIIYSIFKKLSYKNRNKILSWIMKWNDVNGEEITYGVDLPCDGSWGKIFRKEDMFPLVKIEFCNNMFYGPKDYEKILKTLYGDYLTLPKEEDRQWHAKKIEIYK